MPVSNAPANTFARLVAGASGILRHKLVWNSAVYAGSGVVRNAIPFLLLPVLTRYLSPTDFGIVATFEVMLAIGLVFVGLNMSGAIAVNYFRFERKALEIYVANVILISVVIAASICIIALVVFNVLSLELVVSPTRWVPLLAVAALSQVLFSIALTLWQVEQRPLPYGVFQILQTALNVGLSLLFVMAFNWGWQGRVLAIIAASAAFGVLSLVIIRGRWHAGFALKKDYLVDALKFGVPLVPHSLGNWVLTGIDRLFIASMVGVAATGIYTVGYQVGMIVGLVATSFNQAWSPFLFEKLTENSPEAKLKIVRFTYAYIPVIILLALTVSVVAPWFLGVFVGPQFQGAQQFVLWIALGYAANGMYMMVATYIFFAKKTHLLAIVTLVTATVNVMLNYFLIRRNGPIGAAQASAGSFFLGFVLTWILSARVYRMPWRLRYAGS